MNLGDILHSSTQWVKGRAWGTQPGSVCLGYALCLLTGKVTWGERADSMGTTEGWRDPRMSRIVWALFPERILNDFISIVSFNNHPDTRWEDIEKVVRLYDEEIENGVPEKGY